MQQKYSILKVINWLLIISGLAYGNMAFAQNNALIIKDAAYICLKGGTGVHLIINSQVNTGISLSGTAAGGIINTDNNEADYVDWIIKNGAINDYIIPWRSTELTSIPLTYHIGTIGSNDGTVSFSTWRTGTTTVTKTALG